MCESESCLNGEGDVGVVGGAGVAQEVLLVYPARERRDASVAAGERNP